MKTLQEDVLAGKDPAKYRITWNRHLELMAKLQHEQQLLESDLVGYVDLIQRLASDLHRNGIESEALEEVRQKWGIHDEDEEEEEDDDDDEHAIDSELVGAARIGNMLESVVKTNPRYTLEILTPKSQIIGPLDLELSDDNCNTAIAILGYLRKFDLESEVHIFKHTLVPLVRGLSGIQRFPVLKCTIDEISDFGTKLNNIHRG